MTNLAASIRMEVKSDATPPTIAVQFIDDTKYLYKTADLNLHELLYHLNVTIHDKKAAMPKKWLISKCSCFVEWFIPFLYFTPCTSRYRSLICWDWSLSKGENRMRLRAFPKDPGVWTSDANWGPKHHWDHELGPTLAWEKREIGIVHCDVISDTRPFCYSSWRRIGNLIIFK